MLLSQDPYRSASRGEIFTVLRHDLIKKRIYVAFASVIGGNIALNVPQDACEFVLNDSEADFAAALSQLGSGKLAEAVNNFSKMGSAGGRESVYVQLKDCTEALQKALRDIAVTKQREAEASDSSKKKFKNALSAEAVVFGKTDTQRAEKLRLEGQAMVEAARNALTTASQQLERAINRIQNQAAEQTKEGAYDIADALLSCLSALQLSADPRGRHQNLNSTQKYSRSVFQQNEDERAFAQETGMLRLPPPINEEIPLRVAKAHALCSEALSASQDRKLYEARKQCVVGLAAMPGHRRLLKLKEEVQNDIKLLEWALSITRVYQDRGADLAELRPLIKLANSLCTDSEPLKKVFSQVP